MTPFDFHNAIVEAWAAEASAARASHRQPQRYGQVLFNTMPRFLQELVVGTRHDPYHYHTVHDVPNDSWDYYEEMLRDEEADHGKVAD